MDQSELCAARLFENHRQFAARATYAQKQIERLPEIIQQRKDEAILSMSLARPEIGSLPQGSHSGSSTEHAAIYWEKNVAQDVNLMVNQLYFGFFGEGHNVTMDWLSRNGCWPNGGYPTSYVLSRAQFEQILREAGVDVENVIINQA